MSKTAYTFSKTRLFTHIFLTLVSGFVWVPFGAVWEWYRYNKA